MHTIPNRHVHIEAIVLVAHVSYLVSSASTCTRSTTQFICAAQIILVMHFTRTWTHTHTQAICNALVHKHRVAFIECNEPPTRMKRKAQRARVCYYCYGMRAWGRYGRIRSVQCITWFLLYNNIKLALALIFIVVMHFFVIYPFVTQSHTALTHDVIHAHRTLYTWMETERKIFHI